MIPGGSFFAGDPFKSQRRLCTFETLGKKCDIYNRHSMATFGLGVIALEPADNINYGKES